MKFNWLKQMQILSWRSLQNFNCMLEVNSTVLYCFPKILMYSVEHHTFLSYILLALLFYKCVWWSNVMIYGDEIWNKEEDLRLDHWTNLQRLLIKELQTLEWYTSVKSDAWYLSYCESSMSVGFTWADSPTWHSSLCCLWELKVQKFARKMKETYFMTHSHLTDNATDNFTVDP